MVKYFTCCAVNVHRQVVLAVKLFLIHLELLHLHYVKEGGLKCLHYCEILFGGMKLYTRSQQELKPISDLFLMLGEEKLSVLSVVYVTAFGALST